MKKPAFLITSVILPIIMALTMVYVGCEDVPDMEGLSDYFDSHPYLIDPRENPEAADLVITPAFVTIEVEGEQVVFMVSGGDGPFDWDVVDPIVGSIQEQPADNNAVYTANTLGMNNIIVSDERGHVAIGTVNGEPGALEISPASVSLSDGAQVQLIVTGGTTPYQWTVVYPNRGFIVGPPVGGSVLYQRDTSAESGDNILTVIDYHGRTTSREISQGGALRISPRVASGSGVDVGQGGDLPFSASGGIPPYTFTGDNNTYGTVSPTGLYTGNSNGLSGEVEVTVWDSDGNNDQSYVNQTNP